MISPFRARPRASGVNPNGLKGSTELRAHLEAPGQHRREPHHRLPHRVEFHRCLALEHSLVPGPTGTATTYLHTGLAPNTSRYYRVRALNAQGQGAPGRPRSEAPPTPHGPASPGTCARAAAGPTSITLTWEAPTSDGGARITGYTHSGARPQRRTTWITIPRNTGPQETTFTHTGLQPATAYRYQVAAINRMGARPVVVRGEHEHVRQAPGAPFGLTAQAVGTARIDLSWSAPRNTGGAPILGYRIEASDDGGDTGGSSAATPARRRRSGSPT